MAISKTTIFLALFFFLSFVSSRKLSPQKDTAILDVSASIERTHQVLTSEPSIFQNSKPLSHSSDGVYSLPLHPRSSLLKNHHKDYRSLSLSRLAHDSARVDSLLARLDFALNQFNKSEMRPLQAEILPEDLSIPVKSGISQGSGEYFTRIGVGQPAKSFYMAIDTGSDVNWLQCEPCNDCYQQTDPVYKPSESSTYGSLTCASQQCTSLEISACRSDSCLYQVSYGDGSYTVGDFVTETISFDDSGSVPNLAIGCGHDNEGLFVGAAGLVGLGGGQLSLTSQLKANSFSYCLVDRDASGSSTLEFNSPLPGGSITAPLLRNNKLKTFFYVGVTGITVGGQPLSIPPSVFAVDDSGHGGIILDSGTAITRLQADAYNSLRDAFVEDAQNLKPTTGFSLFDTCFDMSGLTTVSVPTVGFQLVGGKSLMLHPKNYLIPVDSNGKFCLAFAPTQGSLSIIGNVQQQGTRVSYDLANSLVGFSTNNC